MKGAKDREVFRALSPVNLEYERLGSFMSYKVDEQLVLTYVVRQYSDVWRAKKAAAQRRNRTGGVTSCAKALPRRKSR